MKDFAEGFRLMNELAYKDEGYEDVKAVIFENEVDYDTDPTVKEFTEKGYKVIDENMFGMGDKCLGRVVVFAKQKEI